MIDANDLMQLIYVTERIRPQQTFLSDVFFPNVETYPTPNVMMEYRTAGSNKLAPYVVQGSKGQQVKRQGSVLALYNPPLMAPRRVITQADMMRRGFGETPYYSTLSAEERQRRLQMDDLRDLVDMIANRKNEMAASLLSTGKITVEGYDDAGYKQRLDEIEYEHLGDAVIMVPWSNANAKIYEDLQTMSETIQETSGMVPTVLVVGKNVPGYLMKNETLKNWLMIPNRETGSFMSFAPQYQFPQVQYIGKLTALNLDIYSYNATYRADDGTVQRYVGANDVIMGIPGRGKCVHAAVPLLIDGEFRTVASQYVPRYTVNEEENMMMLTLWTKFVLMPDYAFDWVHATVAV